MFREEKKSENKNNLEETLPINPAQKNPLAPEQRKSTITIHDRFWNEMKAQIDFSTTFSNLTTTIKQPPNNEVVRISPKILENKSYMQHDTKRDGFFARVNSVFASFSNKIDKTKERLNNSKKSLEERLNNSKETLEWLCMRPKEIREHPNLEKMHRWLDVILSPNFIRLVFPLDKYIHRSGLCFQIKDLLPYCWDKEIGDFIDTVCDFCGPADLKKIFDAALEYPGELSYFFDGILPSKEEIKSNDNKKRNQILMSNLENIQINTFSYRISSFSENCSKKISQGAKKINDTFEIVTQTLNRVALFFSPSDHSNNPHLDNKLNRKLGKLYHRLKDLNLSKEEIIRFSNNDICKINIWLDILKLNIFNQKNFLDADKKSLWKQINKLVDYCPDSGVIHHFINTITPFCEPKQNMMQKIIKVALDYVNLEHSNGLNGFLEKLRSSMEDLSLCRTSKTMAREKNNKQLEEIQSEIAENKSSSLRLC